MITRKYNLIGKYQKMFDAIRGKYSRARTTALFKAGEAIPNFKHWGYVRGACILTITWETAPTYLEEDDFFDFLETAYNVVA